MSEKLQWHFETTKNTFSGANDPIHETFRANPYYSIVRESIQNSLDVRMDTTKPVEVRFEIISINQIEHPELFSLREHIKSCFEFHKGNQQAEDLYGGMLKYLDDNPSVKILKVSDFNTIGMSYEPNNHLCPFTSFMGEGISSKNSGAGGSFGFGKGAYYVPSELRTILVSTRLEDGGTYFQGRTRLASHLINGVTKGKDGVFNCDHISPVNDSNKIGAIFRRQEIGTDVYILGMLPDPDCGKEMVKSVLNNFWLAVHENKLDVVIRTGDVDIRFDEANLELIMNTYFHEEVEYGQSDIYQWNPKAYYKAVKYARQSEDFILFEESLPILGEVKFYVYRNEHLMNKISFLRKPNMTVFKAGRNVLSGYAAVFVCESDQGNEILRQMENAAHNEWKPENVRYIQKSEMKIYNDAKKELNDFVRDKLKSIAGIENSSKIEIAGLANYLTIPEELLDEADSIYGNAANLRSGLKSENDTSDETGLMSSTNTPIIIKPKVTNLHSDLGGKSVQNDGPNPLFSGGISNETDGGNKQGVGIGEQSSVGALHDEGKSLMQIPVRFRNAAIQENNQIIHNLIITSDKDYNSVNFVLNTGTDNGEFVSLTIGESSSGIPEGSSIINARLCKGKNIIKVKFNDGIKHNLKLTAYEA